MIRTNRCIYLALCLLLGPIALRAQAPATPPAESADDTGGYQIKAQVRRVILDIVVTDSKGRPVEGLKQDDFQVAENGVAQPIRSFNERSNATATASQPPLDLHLPPDTFSNLSLAPPDKPVTILLYDMLNTPQAALPFAHQALVKFIKDQKSSTQIAIFILTDRLHMLQGFTDDETRLMEAIDAKTLKSHASQLRVADSSSDAASLLAADPAAAAAAQNQLAVPTAGAGAVGADAILAQLQSAEAEESAYLLTQRLETTVRAFTEIAKFVSVLPGRKNLIWMSGSFPSSIFPDSTQTSGAQNEFNNAVNMEADVRLAQNELKDSRIAVYPVDVRGLQADPQFSAASRYNAAPPTTGSFGVQQAAEHATMNAVADSTGGHAFYNTNGLQEAMDSAIREGSEYYSLTYQPTNTKADGGERKIKVALKQPGYHLSYRRYYLADDATHPAPPKPLTADVTMQHGAPNSSELFFEAKVVPVGGAMAASPAEAESLRTFLETNAAQETLKGKGKPKPLKPLTGPLTVQHYDINLAILGPQLQMPPTANDRYSTDMKFGLAAFTADGDLLNGAEVTIKNAIPAAQYQKIETTGYHASMVFAVPQDAVSLRIAVRDQIGNHTGTIEIPIPLHVAQNAPAGIAPKK